ncbi:MAG TPA: PilT/PilU family type 4a pilus ATPase [Kofleriaceae bacterium]
MGAQLDQILAYLDKEGVTEIMIGMGQPASLRRRGQLIKITNTPVTRGQINILVGGTPLEGLIPAGDGVAPRADMQIGARMVRALITRRGEDIVIRIEKSPPGATPTAIAAPVAAPLRAPTATPARGVPTPPLAGPRGNLTFELDPEVTPPPALAPDAPIAPPKDTSKPALAAYYADVIDEAGDAEELTLEAPAPKAAPAAAAPKKMTPPTTAFGKLIATAIERGATDLHIASGRVTSIRVLNELVPVDPEAGNASHEDAEALLLPLIDKEQQERLKTKGYVDLALASPTGGRLRANISRAAGGIKGTFRIARTEPSSLEELGLPKELAKVVQHHQGLVVIAGPSGHGKTTSLAALVDLVNANRPHHIITVEDPIEIVYPRKAAVVSQREVGPHTKSFAAALKGSLREDPDVIVIGELRDKETVEIALTAAETGHLVLATMSTPNAAKTIDRLVGMFPPEDQQQVRSSIAGALRAIVSQRLVPTIAGGVTAAIELVTGVIPLAAMIRDDKLFQLPSLLQRGRSFGMIRLDESLMELVRSGRISTETALATTENRKELAIQLDPTAKSAATPAGGVPATPGGEQPKSRFGGLFGGKKDK